MSKPLTGRLTRADIARWINEAERREPTVETAHERLRAAVRLGVEGNSVGYRSLASFALGLSADHSRLRDSAIKVNESKGRDYTQGSEDILKNFYEVAKICGVSPLVVWGVYVTKHVEAIGSWLVGVNESEPIEGRLVDTLVYAALGHFVAEREAGVC